MIPVCLRSSVSRPSPAAMASAGSLDLDRLAVDGDRAGVDLGDTEDRLEDLGPAGAHEAGQAEDLAAAEVEVMSLTTPSARVSPWTDITHLADVRVLLREHVGQLAADHQRDELAGDRARTPAASTTWRPSRNTVT